MTCLARFTCRMLAFKPSSFKGFPLPCAKGTPHRWDMVIDYNEELEKKMQTSRQEEEGKLNMENK